MGFVFSFSFSSLSSRQDVETSIPELYIPKGRAFCFSEDTASLLDVLAFVEPVMFTPWNVSKYCGA